MPFGAILGALGGGLISAVGANNAANTMANSANAAAGVTQNMFNTTQQNLQPYMAAGGNALGTLQGLLGISPTTTTTTTPGAAGAGGLPAGYSVSPNYTGGMATGRGSGGVTTGGTLSGYTVTGPNGQVVGQLPASSGGNAGSLGLGGPTTSTTTTPATPGSALSNALTSPTNLMLGSGSLYTGSPGYQFQLEQGLGAATNSAAAKGGIVGGNTLAQLQQYGSGLAGQNYYQWLVDYMNQANNYLNQVAGVAHQGQNAAANLGSFSGNAASSIGNSLMGAGSALGAGQIGVSNALTNGVQGIDWSALMSGGGSGAGPYSGAWGY